jgi:lysine-arginine-ornithine-binding protein
MNILKWGGLACVLALGAMVPVLPAAADDSPLKIGVDGSYPPFSQTGKGGKLTGFDIDIANALCEEIKARCELVPMGNWADVIPAVEAGKYDFAVASMSITDERLKRIDFTNKYYQAPAKFVAKDGTKVASIADLAGKRIGVQEGTTHSDFLLARFTGTARITTYPTLDAALEDLEKGRLDVVMGDSLALEVGFLETKAGKGFAFVGPDFSEPAWFGMGNGIALPKQRDALREKLNRAISNLRSDGRYQTIAAKYFQFDIYGQ